ncbi:hypothetical protein H2203_007629 [Taxawa tesnikishii (nom. ined.)]|nr:hypothetical protein H2203_007629 [Dothideales sp. JES 119]
MLVLPETDISAILRNLTPDHASRLLHTLSSGLAAYTEQVTHSTGKPRIHQPHRTSIVTDKQDTTLVMPVSDSTITSVKVVTIPQRGDIKGAITIYNTAGHLEGVLNAAEITAFRTALTTLTMLTRCKTLPTRELVMFGAGKQIEWHARLALHFLDGVKRITVVNRGRARLVEFERGLLQELRGSYPDVVFETIAKEDNNRYEETLRSKLKDADVICCCTPSREPLFGPADLQNDTKKARFISLVGSYKPEMQEIPTEILRSADAVWMQPEELSEIGELLLQGPDAQATADSEPRLIIFKCVGLGVMDLVIGKALLELAEELGKGTMIPEF